MITRKALSAMSVALSVAMTGLPGLAQAQYSKGTYETRFTSADKNKDGKLSRAEASAGLTPTVNKEFDKMDANKDGFVTRQERDDWMRSQKPPAKK